MVRQTRWSRAGTWARVRRTSLAERMTGSLASGLARANSTSAGQGRRRVFSQKSLKAQMAWVLVWRATFFSDLRWMQYCRNSSAQIRSGDLA